MILDLGAQGFVWVRSVKNGGKDLPDRWDSRSKSRDITVNCKKWGTEAGGAEAGEEPLCIRGYCKAMKKRVFPLAS